jgi:hypothetical protein
VRSNERGSWCSSFGRIERPHQGPTSYEGRTQEADSDARKAILILKDGWQVEVTDKRRYLSGLPRLLLVALPQEKDK